MKRLTTNTFPPYTYVPGQQPHPRSHPLGHSHGLPDPVVADFDPSNWQACEAYLFGFDLFNHGFYWESHEQWEAVWLAVGRTGVVADLLKGLIKLAAAGVKAKEANEVGFNRHLARATELYSSVAGEHERLCGLELQALIEAAQTESCEQAIARGTLATRIMPKFD